MSGPKGMTIDEHARAYGWAAYCSSCDRFDESMRVRNDRPHCRYCGAGFPGAWPPTLIIVSTVESAFICALRTRIEREREAAEAT